jgi:predicted lipoprotein
MMRIMTRALLLLVAVVGLAGCGVVAAPVRATSAVVKVVPAAGDVVAKPLDVTADVID